jgi:phosphohistidine phosphatase
MRHGDALPAEQDEQRPLSPTGRGAIERVAWRAATAKFRPPTIYHSGILRAEQTAEILARHLGSTGMVYARAGLEPEDPVPPIAGWVLEQADQDVGIALVGHLPFLDRLASLLVVGDPHPRLLSFEPGALVKLLPRGPGSSFSVCWMLVPGVV